MDNQKNHQREGKAVSDGFGGGSGAGGGDAGRNSNHPPPRPCPRCHCDRTKFCYFNNYSMAQPRYYCKGCKRYWTQGGTLRNVPIGGTCRKSKRPRTDASTSAAPPTVTPPPMLQENYLQHQRLVTTALGGANGNGGGRSGVGVGVGDMLFGVSENTNNAARLFLQTLLGSHEPRQMSQPPHLMRDLGFGNSLTLRRYLPNNKENPQLFPNVYSIREAGSSSAPAASMAGEWTIGSIQPDAPQVPPSLLASNNDNINSNMENITVNDDDDENDEISRQWADYMGDGGLGGEP